jgi:hypothetical protein
MMKSDAELALVTAGAFATELNASARARMSEGDCLFELVEEQAFWAQVGIVTGLDLARDLDASFEREMEKQRMYGYDEFVPEELLSDPMPADAGWFI